MNRPFICLYHFIIEIASYVFMFASIIWAAVFATGFEGQVPISYDAHGEITGYGSPWFMIIMPIAMLLCLGLMSLCLHVIPPQKWNTGVKITEQNAFFVYRDIALMVSLFSLILGIYTFVFTIAECAFRSDLITWFSIGLVVASTAVVVFIFLRIRKY